MTRLYLLHVFEGCTRDNQILEFKPEAPIENVRCLRVVTKESPSWVGWKETEVLAPWAAREMMDSCTVVVRLN